jgi:TRAP-type mannitol/chloroaromatic compound transport system permease small subunit
MLSAEEAVAVSDELVAGRRGEIRRMPADMPAWMGRTILGIDRASLWVGRVVAWLVVPLMLAMMYEVVARSFFHAPTIWAYDISRMLYGAFFMLGAAYALAKGVHIRADFLYRRLDVRVQGWIDTILYLTCYFPALIVFLLLAYDYALVAWLRGQRGTDTAWMPLLGPIKTALPLGIALLLIQGVSETLKSYYAATRGRWPDA